jgi:cation transport regulator
VPYDRNEDLPQAVRDHLPERAQSIYREAFNSAWQQYADDAKREEIAHRVAWTAVKHKYHKKGDRWVPNI